MPTEDELVRLHKPIVLYCARSYTGRGVEHADLVQVGLIGLLDAIRSYDDSKPMKMSSWISLLARQRMSDAIGRRQRRTTVLDDPDLIVDSSRDESTKVDFADALAVVRGKMTELQADVFFAWLGIGIPEPISIGDIAKRYHVARQKVMQIIAYGLQLCRDCFGIDSDLRSVRIARTTRSISG